MWLVCEERWPRWLAKGLRQINPYVAGQRPNGPDMIKLNTNEMLMGGSKVAEALQNFDTQELRKYSSLDQAELCQAGDKLGCIARPARGNGSDDILSMAWPSLTEASQSCFGFDLWFYKVWADLYYVPLNPLTADF